MFPSNFVKLLESPPPQPAKPAAAYPTPQGRGDTHTKGPYTLHTKLQGLFGKKSLRKSLLIYETVEKIVAAVEKSCSVYGR